MSYQEQRSATDGVVPVVATRPGTWATSAKYLVGITLAGMLVASAVSPANAESPNEWPTLARPSEPPPEAINCVRPDQQKVVPSLSAPSALAVVVDEQAKSVSLDVGQTPEGATCYAIFRSPSGSNPVAFAWDPLKISAPGRVADPIPFAFAGRYCYQLYFGSPAGVSAPSEACVEVPTSIAPEAPPPPTQAVKPPPAIGAPDTGSGPPASSGGTDGRWLAAVSVLAVSLAAGGFTLRRRRIR